MPEPVVVTEHLAKTFKVGFLARKVEAVTDVSLEVREGEIFGLLGPNGAGKTTTLKMLLGFVKPTSGKAFVAGLPAGSPEARRRFGYLPENPALYEFLRGDELLTYLGRLSGLSTAEAKRRGAELLELVGLSGRGIDRPIRKFSKGMVQRLAIAQALLTDPPIVLLDEPMSGLDPVGRKDVRDLMFSLKERGKTVFFSTHILPDVEAICDRVGIITGGRLTDYGALSELVDTNSSRVDVVLGQVPAPLLARLQGDFPQQVIVRDAQVVVRAPGQAPAEGVVRAAMEAGARLVSFQPHRGSLEELFVRRANEQKAGQAARASAS